MPLPSWSNAKGLHRLIVTEPGEWRLMQDMQNWHDTLGIEVEILHDSRFIADHAEFEGWAEGKKQLRMEFFYREMRRKTGLLMDGDEPLGGQWNYDADNRKKLPKGSYAAAAPAFCARCVNARRACIWWRNPFRQSCRHIG